MLIDGLFYTLHQAFSILDQNSDGLIDKDDLTQMNNQLGKWRPRPNPIPSDMTFSQALSFFQLRCQN